MGVKIKKRGSKWYIYVNYHGKRKNRCVGSREAAEKVRRELEARLALGHAGFFREQVDNVPTFATYCDKCLSQYRAVQCKHSTVAGYQRILKHRLLPEFGASRLDLLTRDQLKQFISKLAGTHLSRSTLRNTLCAIRVILNQAIEDGVLDKNPAARLGRFTKSDKPKFQATALTRDEANQFLEAAQQICPDYYGLFLAALRAGLRRGELVALRWGGHPIWCFRRGPESVHPGPAQLREPSVHNAQE
jgi:integrase